MIDRKSNHCMRACFRMTNDTFLWMHLSKQSIASVFVFHFMCMRACLFNRKQFCRLLIGIEAMNAWMKCDAVDLFKFVLIYFIESFSNCLFWYIVGIGLHFHLLYWFFLTNQTQPPIENAFEVVFIWCINCIANASHLHSFDAITSILSTAIAIAFY